VSLGAGIPLSPAQVPPVVHEQLDAAQRLALRADVKRLLAEHSARTATFGEEVKRLAVADPQAHHLLLEQLAVPGAVAEAPSS